MSTSFEDTFRQRLVRLYDKYVLGDAAGFGAAQAVVVATSVIDPDADVGYHKSFALITWLCGSELQGAGIVLTKHAITLAVPPADVGAFRPLAGKGPGSCPDIKVMDAEADLKGFKDILAKAVTPDTVVGLLTKESKIQTGVLARTVIDAASGAKEQVNIATALANILAVKDADEIARVRKAAILSAAVFRFAMLQRIEKTIDQDKKCSHLTLADVAEDAITNPTKVNVKGLRPELCDPCYPPIIQSASKDSKDRVFDLRPSAESNEDSLHFGCIIASLGARYSFYCSNISRTLLVDPSKAQEKSYGALLKAQAAAIEALVPGAKLSSAYHAAVSALKSSGLPNAADLVAGLGKNVGFGTGIEYRDSALVLSAKNDLVVQEDMVFNVAVGSEKLKDEQNGTYALFLADTIHVRGRDLQPDIFTSSARKDFQFISYELGGEEEEDLENDVEESDDKAGRSSAKKGASQRGAVLSDAEASRGARRRFGSAAEGDAVLEANAEEERRRKHQTELEKRMLDRGRARLAGADGGTQTLDVEEKKKNLDEVIAYRSSNQFPSMRGRQLAVDMDAESLLVPINGVPVPFHISTIKGATKSDEGMHTYLRINFHVPQGASLRTSNFSRVAQNAPQFPDLDKRGNMTSAFVKELSFRSSNPQNLSDCMRKIKELVKRTSLKETEEREKETLVTQEKVRFTKGGRVPFITDVNIRPNLASGAKSNRGVLEAHTNGFYFRAKSDHVEIVYSNIRNAFFQEADRETIVCVHFHLKHPIMVGKKKSSDVQFYIEVMESAVRLNDKRRRHFDQDELEEEQREREMRNRTNKMFLKFTKEVEERCGLEFDIPYRSLAFTGAPRSAAVTLLPTVNCIIDVIDWPPFVLNLQDVEIAHFERVEMQLRNFDLVFVFKNFQEDPGNIAKPVKDMWMRISAIEIEDLVPIKKYLDEQEIKYYEGPMSLQWNNVLKSVRSDFEAFYDDGAWQFLSNEAGDGDGEEEEDSLEGDEEFEVPEDLSEEDVESDEDSSEYSESDASGDVRAELEGDSDEGEEDLSSDEEGLDWDEQERKAKAEDAKRIDLSDDDDDKRGRKRGKAGSSQGKPDAAKQGRKRRH
jgi:nucleosome binding factor SPN SPT16 subunit